jgi:hypothetical protein
VSCECALLQPVDVEHALRKKPRAVHLDERVQVAQRSEHQASLSASHRDVMRQAVSFSGGPLGSEREDRALSDEVRSGVILVQVREDGSERLA